MIKVPIVLEFPNFRAFESTLHHVGAWPVSGFSVQLYSQMNKQWEDMYDEAKNCSMEPDSYYAEDER